LFLVLDAEDQVIFSHKREIPREELRRQRKGYRLLSRDERATLIKANQEIDRTVEEAARVVVKRLSRRFKQHNARWLTAAS